MREQFHVRLHSLHAINQHFNWLREYLRLRWSQWTSPVWFVTLGGCVAVFVCVCVCVMNPNAGEVYFGNFGCWWSINTVSVWPAGFSVCVEFSNSSWGAWKGGLSLGIAPSQQYLQDWGFKRWNKSNVHQFLREKQGLSQYYNIFIVIGMRFAQLQEEAWLYLTLF